MSEHARHAMSAQEAAWVREHAWLGSMRRTYATFPYPYDRCFCSRFCGHGDVCIDCQEGNHAACTQRMERWPANAPLCWVTDTQGRVPILDGVDSWQVWDATVVHDPRCTCYISGHPGAVAEEASSGAVQGDLLSLLEVA